MMGILKSLFGQKMFDKKKFEQVLGECLNPFIEELQSSPLLVGAKLNKAQIMIFVCCVEIAVYLSGRFIKNPDRKNVTDFMHSIADKMANLNGYDTQQRATFLRRFDDSIMKYCPIVEEYIDAAITDGGDHKLMPTLSLLVDEFLDSCIVSENEQLAEVGLTEIIGELLQKMPRRLLS